ncbi:colanic acid exporter [compost metagenome]
MLAEAIIVAVALFTAYAKVVDNPLKWKASKERAHSLLKDSWPLIVSASAWIVYVRTDQIMVGQMIDDEALGFYSAATQLSEAVNVLPVIIAFSIIPAISKLREINRSLYDQRFQLIYDVVVGVMFLMALSITLLSVHIVRFLYGEAYSSAATVLSIYSWVGIAVAMATVSGRYLLNEGLQRITMQRHLLGIAINIPMNLAFISWYGAEGAAVASLITFFIVNFMFDAFSWRTRVCFKHKLNSLFLVGLIRYVARKVK